MVALTTEQLKARMSVMRGPVVDTNHDFTTMTLAEFDTAYPLWSGGSKRYCLKANGDYVERDTDKAPLTDLGLWRDGAFVNLAPGSLINGAVPDFLNIQEFGTPTVTYESLLGIPGIRYAGTLPSGVASNAPNLYADTITADAGTTLAVTCIAAVNASTKTLSSRLYSAWSDGTAAVAVGVSKTRSLTNTGTESFVDYIVYNAASTAAEGDNVDVTLSGYQQVKMAFPPNVLALSSAATTAKTADIVQRAVDLRGPFAVEIVATTAPGDPGAHQTYWCQSLGENDYAHIYRATGTNEITIKVRANGVDYSVACGPVADNTQFTLRLGMRFNGVDWSLNENTAATLTIKRSASYVLESVGTFYDATLPGWCSVQSIRVAAGKIATAAEIEGGWA